ncbi:hypothetical protein [Fodinibius sp. AD559]|uniref:hypothetical protein n=1 Tax=Fodinibius sp. AD559 TaxID=3424179 RepID=UPI004046909F
MKRTNIYSTLIYEGFTRLAWCMVASLMLVVVGCSRPYIEATSIHPDSDEQIEFTASRGDVEGTITKMEIEVDGTIVASDNDATATYTGGPYPTHSNSKLTFAAIATKSGGDTVRKSDWVYVANPKNVYSYTSPSGSNDGYPDATSEQTGANLYRLDKSVVRNHAINAIMEYANANSLSVFEVFNTANHLVAAVARYVDEHMSWRSDGTNPTVFADNGYEDYSPGWDFPQPADLTLTISGNLTNATPNDDFQGDCEDHAILRAALLRALGFAPWAIWDAIDNPVSHEYNIVLYEGAYRLMDYGTIDRWLDTHTWDSHRSFYGWNENNGPRGASSTQNNYLKNNTDNYPGGKSDGQPWSYEIYYKDVSP